MEKVVIVGCPGAGKTTFARELNARLQIPLHHLDAHFWKENWTQTPEEEFITLQTRLMQGKQWIIEGHYRKSVPHRIKMADTIIVFDFPKSLCFWRAIKRYFQYRGMTRSDIGGNNKEALRWDFIKYIYKFDRKALVETVERLSEGKNLIVFHNPKEVANFLARV